MYLVYKRLHPIPREPVVMLLSRQVAHPISPFAWPSPSYLLSINAPLAKPSAPVVSVPTSRATPGQTVNFTCKSYGFSPRNITLKWFKGGKELPSFQPIVEPKGESISYNISSTAQVVLSSGDVHSQVICQVDHDTLEGRPLRGIANLSDIIRGRCPGLLAQTHSSH